MRIDLQFHSTYSDGSLTPAQLVNFLSKQKVRVAALTDHNTVAGLDEFFAACRRKKIKPISGIEFYVRYGSKKMNFLFYNFDRKAPELRLFLEKTQAQRRKNITKALEFWQERGMNIDIEKILSRYNYYIPINGVIKLLKKDVGNRKKIKEDLKSNDPHEWEIIRYYFKNRNKYYLNETHVSIARLKKLHQRIGGKIILAHPAKQKVQKEIIIKLLKEKIIDGVEILSPHHSWDTISYYYHILKNKKIILTGGSDFHGFSSRSARLNCSWQYFKIDSKLLRKIEDIIK